MSFIQTNFMPYLGGGRGNGPAFYTYQTEDILETVLNDAYFNDALEIVDEGTLIYAFCSDKSALIYVTSNDATLPVTTAPITAGFPGTGTVTSVGIGVPSYMSVSDSPITVAGTMTLSFNNESANTFFAGPTSGAAAAPSWRVFSLSDLPPAAQGTLLYAGASGWTTLAPGTSGQVLTTQGASANPIWTSDAGGDVKGPSSSTNTAIALYNGTTGKIIQNSVVTVSGTGAFAGDYPAMNEVTANTLTLNLSNVGQAFSFTYAGTVTVTIADAATISEGNCWYCYTHPATTINFVKQNPADTIYGQTTLSPQESCTVVNSINAYFYIVPGVQNAGPGAGDVVGPSSSIAGDIASYADGTGKLIQDSTLKITNASGVTSLISTNILGLVPAGGSDLQINLSGSSKANIINSAAAELHLTNTAGTYGTAIRQETGSPDGLEIVSTLNADNSDVNTLMILSRDGTIRIPSGNVIGNANGLYSISQFSRNVQSISSDTLALTPTNIGSYFSLSYAGTVTVTIGISTSFVVGAWWGIKCLAGTTVNFVLAGAPPDTLQGDSTLGSTESCTISLVANYIFENTPGLQNAGPGSGDVSGPSSATQYAIAAYADTTGKLIQNTSVVISPNDTIYGPSTGFLYGFNQKTTIVVGLTMTLAQSDVGQCFILNSPGAATINVPASGSLTLGFYATVKCGPNTTASFVLAGSPTDQVVGNPDILSDGASVIRFANAIQPVFEIDPLFNPSAVSGPLGATDNNIAVYDGISGQVIKNSAIQIDPTTGALTITYDGDWFLNGYAGRDINISATSGNIILTGLSITLGSPITYVPATSGESFNLLVLDAESGGKAPIAKIGPTSNNGWVLTSNGTVTAPTFQPIPGTGLSDIQINKTIANWVDNLDGSSTLTISAVETGFTTYRSIQIYETSGVAGEAYKNAPATNMTVFNDHHIEIYCATSVVFDATILIVGLI